MSFENEKFTGFIKHYRLSDYSFMTLLPKEKNQKGMEKSLENPNKIKRKGVSYAKWGYIFILPFFIAYLAFTLYPQILTIFYSFTEYRKSGIGVEKLLKPSKKQQYRLR